MKRILATVGVLLAMSVSYERSRPAIASHVAIHGMQQPGARGRAPGAVSTSCVGCHKGAKDPHPTSTGLSCVDCHGGNGSATNKEDAHPRPKHPEKWHGSANPHGSFALLNDESREWIRFVNPSDLRAADTACGSCHGGIVRHVRKSPMVNSAQVYSTGLYNNGSVPFKDALFAEQYSPSGQPQAIRTIPPPTAEETRTKGVLPILFPLPRFEIGQSGTFFRVFERGGGPKSELGNPNREDVPGQPDVTVTNRGFGTQGSVDPVILGAQKTRLNDPVMSFLGTNDSAGDYRTSGCGSCHVVYANDREPANSGPYAKYGNRGLFFGDDAAVPKNEPGHPIRHEFTRRIPSSQCITCHVHNGNGFLNSYLGYMWWDQQTDGEHLYPKQQRNPTPEEIDRAGRFNPEEAAARGLWHDAKFLETLSELNPQLRKAQFSDYHGHGWVFQRVYNRDRKGNILDKDGKPLSFDDAELFKKAVHLKDIHLEKGMHCVDCHFAQDSHGNGKIYGDRRAAIEIDCVDCHGTLQARTTLQTSGPASPGTDLSQLQTPSGQPRFTSRGGRVTQRSMVSDDLEWQIPQVLDTITPGNPRYNERSRLAKTLRKDGAAWGDAAGDAQLAHANSRMTCYSCHSSWVTNCFGCHFGVKVNTKRPMLHNEGNETQTYASYNPQVLRTDAFMLGVDGTVQGNKVVPMRSSSSVNASVQNANREWVVNHGYTISAAGFNGHAFNGHVPHTVRGKETKQCTDCHVSSAGDNNAWLAALLLQGTNQVNFLGRYIWAALGEGGFSAVAVTERDEPQAVYGSHLHRLAYPAYYARHQAKLGVLSESRHRGGTALQVQQYGEYLLAAAGRDGFRVYDIANVANKGFSQAIVTAPFATQRMRVGTRDTTGLAVASTSPLDPKRTQLKENEEQPVAPIFRYAFLSDRVEGLVMVDITTLSDGIPTNNRLERAVAFNPEGKLTGASSVTLAGNYAYVTADAGLAVVDVKDPKSPRLAVLVSEGLRAARRVAVQFRYAFVVDAEGLKVLDVTFPERARVVPGARVPLAQAHNVYLARTYAYVAAGPAGLAIVDIERPERPRLEQSFDGGGVLKDVRDVKVGMVNVSLFAFVANGNDGVAVVELTSPESVPGNLGFSPRPAPRIVARFATGAPAMWISEGSRRDRAVDESGNQIAVVGRRGSRPFNLEEMRRMYLRNGQLYTVGDAPPSQPRR